MGKAVFASDLYSLGVTCIHLLTQTDPFECYSIAQGTWVWRDYLYSPISQPLGAILDKLLRRGTSQRYPSAAIVLQDLNSALLKTVTQPLAPASNAPVPQISIHKPATVRSSSIKLSQGRTARKYCAKSYFGLSVHQSIAVLLLIGAGGAFRHIPFAYQTNGFKCLQHGMR